MRCHAPAVMQDLYRRRRRADLHDFPHQVVGHAVEVPVEGHVVVDVHPRPLPFADLESLGGQRLQRWFVEGFEDTHAAAVPLAEGPVVDPVEEFADSLVGLHQREELTVPQRWILAALRHRKFFSLVEANQTIGELLHRINHRPFRKRDGSRVSAFEALDKPALQPLPPERFEISEWERARVNIDYHVAFDGNFYSVPYNLVREVVEIRSTATTVEVLHNGGRVASHVRSRGREQVLTIHAHRPKSHQAHLEWPPSRMVQWAEKIGPHTAQVFERIMADKPHPEMGYRGCLGIIRGRQVLSCAHGGGRTARATE